MRNLKVFILGIIFGLFLKSIIDEIRRRDHRRLMTNDEVQLKDLGQELEMPRIVPRTQPVPQPDQRPAPKRTVAASQPDDLKKIKGIGPVLERKLNAAGITTFEQFSRLTTQELQNILGISKRVVQSADNLITQARKLAQQKSKR